VSGRKRAWTIDGASALRFSSVEALLCGNPGAVGLRRDQKALDLNADHAWVESASARVLMKIACLSATDFPRIRRPWLMQLWSLGSLHVTAIGTYLSSRSLMRMERSCPGSSEK
jgi:hypothetical protein